MMLRGRAPADDRVAVDDALRRLVLDPSSVDFRKLAGGSDVWRLRVGRWRVLVELDSRSGLMAVSRILDRRDAYRG
jgi:mRNA-degrading endonuclease RelE of RelBE toxin-antitoxin system